MKVRFASFAPDGNTVGEMRFYCCVVNVKGSGGINILPNFLKNKSIRRYLSFDSGNVIFPS
jgi:hypothetical protein